MLATILYNVLIGSVLGFLSGLGVGGGSLLILWLTLIANVPQELARSINLLFFLPTALISSLFRWKKGNLQIRKILPAMLGGIAAAVLFTWISQHIQSDALKAPFGVLLLVTGARELFYRPRKPR